MTGLLVILIHSIYKQLAHKLALFTSSYGVSVIFFQLLLQVLLLQEYDVSLMLYIVVGVVVLLMVYKLHMRNS